MTVATSEVTIGDLRLTWDSEEPVAIAQIGPSSFVGRARTELVQLFTAAEQRARTSQAYVRSAVGRRLRYVRHDRHDHDTYSELVIEQNDPATLLTVRTFIAQPTGVNAYRVHSVVRNDGASPVVLTAVNALTIGVGADQASLDAATLMRARSEWLAEDRWESAPLRHYLPNLTLPLHGQDGRGRMNVTSHGSWSTGEHLPNGFITNTTLNVTVGWQIETSSGWTWELCQLQDGAVLTLLGPTEQENDYAAAARPGEEITGVGSVIAVTSGDAAGANAELTRYRRWLRSEYRSEDDMPLVYNDFMNTLMGEPSTEELLPLIDGAAAIGAEVFCIDAGWYADPAAGDWWSTVGEWQQADQRFTHGFDHVLETIRARGMRTGIWLEPEVIGVHSRIAELLPEEAFFHRRGARVREHDRYHLDFRSPAATAHVDTVVDTLVGKGISYFKLDYNINPGSGTDSGAEGEGAGAGLLGHSRAYRDWLLSVRRRHPDISIENCSSGAMRADYHLLAVTQLQSTSDQQDFRRYAPIAASAPLSIVPEQCGNWAYPAASMTDDETSFTLVSGLAGRFYLSGFLHELRPRQTALTGEAIALHKLWRPWLTEATPFWPEGLPAWDDDIVVLGLRSNTTERLFIWSRATTANTVDVPDGDPWTQVFPAARDEDRTVIASSREPVQFAAGASAVVLERSVTP